MRLLMEGENARGTASGGALRRYRAHSDSGVHHCGRGGHLVWLRTIVRALAPHRLGGRNTGVAVGGGVFLSAALNMSPVRAVADLDMFERPEPVISGVAIAMFCLTVAGRRLFLRP